MQKSLINLLGVAVLTWSSQASAVGMGVINVSSALGQPLQASIDLTEVSDAEKPELKARLASPDAYKAAGLEYPAGVSFTFKISEDAKSLVVNSDQAISVPFVSLLVELTWATGKLQRDFTFLVDPVGYTPEQPKLAELQPVSPDAASPSDAPIEKHPLPVENQPAARKKAASPVRDTVTVKRGDTLSKVAAANKPTDVSVERMVVALYRVNTKQFNGNNMNRVKAGTILRIPTQQEIDSVSTAAAKQEIQVQARDWNAYRQQLASASTQVPAAQPAGQQSSSGKIGGSVTDKAPVALDNPNGILKLSTGNAPSDKTVTTQDKQNAKQEDTIAKAKAAQDEQVRAQLAAQTAADTKKLLEMKSQAAALASAAAVPATLSGVLANTGSAVASAVHGSDMAEIGAVSTPATSHVKPVKPVAPVKPQAPEKSLLDNAMEITQPAVDAIEGIDPIYLAGGAAAILGLGGAAVFLSRRKKKVEEEAIETPQFVHNHEDDEPSPFAIQTHLDEEEEDEEEHGYAPPPTPLYPGQNTGSFHTPLQETEDEEDPIEEARLFLSFGRDAQAEDILKDALKKTPNNHQIHLELLGIYANRKDINAFAAVAHQLKDTGDETVWAQAAALGRKLEPDNTLYLRDGEQPEISTQQLSAFNGGVFAQTAGPILDFDIGAFTSKRPAVSPTTADNTDQGLSATRKLDVNIASATAENPALSGDSTGKGNTVFDVTAVHPTIPPSHAVKAMPEPTSMSMDFTMPEMTAMTQEDIEAAKPTPDPTTTPFSLDFPMPDLTPPVTPTPVEVLSMASPMSTMDFAVPDLSMITPPASAPSNDKPSFSTGTIDFAMPDLSALTANMPAISPKAAESGSNTGSSTVMNMDFGGLNLNIGGETSNIPLGDSTSSQSIANKLDLARVYIEMEDPQSAREFIEEVIREGNPQQIATAKEMLQQLG